MSDQIYAFKEWADICDLLAAGKTSVLLRKGGIHEGREGFSFKHDKFLLFPTGFHQQDSGLTDAAQKQLDEVEKIHRPVEEGNEVGFQIYADADCAVRVRDKAIIEKLAPFHVWTEDVVNDRYSYSEKLEADCLSVAVVRIYRLAQPFVVPYQRKFGGCRSWLEVDAQPDAVLNGMTPVISDEEHQQRVSAIRQLLDA